MTDKRRKYVRTRTWNIDEKQGFFPEQDDSDLRVAELESKADLGVCFSGGGTRSASATLGQLRGLRASGLLDRVRYITAVSGGSWAAVPFTYLPDSISNETFLGLQIRPENLTDSDLKNTPDASLAQAISKSTIIDNFLKNTVKLRGDETYAKSVGEIFLKPFGLHESKKFFTWNRKSLDAVLKNNSELIDRERYLTSEDFYLARSGRPYLIVGATLLHNHYVIPMEITPLYLGIREHLRGQGENSSDIGGCYIESFAYDSKFNPEDIGTNPLRVKFWSSSLIPNGKRYFFTLSDVLGVSGAAPVETLKNKGVDDVGFPEFRNWSIHSLVKGHAEYTHGDGGHADNLGIMPMLARGVKNIIVCVNSSRAFQLKGGDKDKRYDSRLAPLFGFAGTPSFDELPATQLLEQNHIFDRDKLSRLLNGLQRAQNQGKSLIYMDTYAIQENKRFRIRPYTGVKIVWIYNADVPAWRDALSPDVDVHLRTLQKDSEFERFPNYRTFGENLGKVIDLSKAQVNALAHLSCWNITENTDEIKQFLGV